MKTRKITKTTISNDVIIEQLQNGRCVLARGIDNISEWKLVVNDIMIKSNRKWYKVKYEIATETNVYYDGIETIYHFTFDICELTKDGYFKIQWHVQEY